jgi:hypothetical protein
MSPIARMEIRFPYIRVIGEIGGQRISRIARRTFQSRKSQAMALRRKGSYIVRPRSGRQNLAVGETHGTVLADALAAVDGTLPRASNSVQ